MEFGPRYPEGIWCCEIHQFSYNIIYKGHDFIPLFSFLFENIFKSSHNWNWCLPETWNLIMYGWLDFNHDIRYIEPFYFINSIDCWWTIENFNFDYFRQWKAIIHYIAYTVYTFWQSKLNHNNVKSLIHMLLFKDVNIWQMQNIAFRICCYVIDKNLIYNL